MEEREVELIDYIQVLWRQKWVIIVTFVAAVAAAYGMSRAIAPTYETRTSLLLLPALSSQLDAEAVGSRLAAETYQELAVSTSLLRMVQQSIPSLESVGLEKLRKRFSVTVKPISSAGELLLSATIQGPSREELPDIAVAWTTSFAETYGEFFQDRIARSYSYVSENYAKTEAELSQLLERRRDLLLSHPIDLLRAELASLQGSAIQNEERLASIRLQLDLAKVRLVALTDELELQPLALTLGSSLTPDSLAAAAAAGLATRDIEKLASIRSDTEYLNSTYVSLDSQIAAGRAALRELEEEIDLREQEGLRLRQALEAKQSEVTDVEAQLADCDRRIELLSTAYAKLAASLQDAKIALAETPEPIRVIDEPLVPLYPVAPTKTKNIAVAGFLGLFVGTLIAFFTDYLTRVRCGRAPAGLQQEGSDQPGRKKTD